MRTPGGVDSFDTYFEVLEASTPEMRQRIFAVRYEVYCVEHQFIDSRQHSDGYESDEFDEVSRHIALIYRPTREVIGTARLILPHSGRPLPVETIIGRGLAPNLPQYTSLIGEISRYAISKKFRRRATDGEVPDLEWSEARSGDPRRLMPHITLGLLRGIATLSTSSDVRFLTACMRPALMRLLASLGLKFTPIGGLVDYHGQRQPCIAERDALLYGLKAHDRRYFAIATRPLSRETPSESGLPSEASVFQGAISTSEPGAGEQPKRDLVEEHCRRIAVSISELAEDAELCQDQIGILETAALFHHDPRFLIGADVLNDRFGQIPTAVSESAVRTVIDGVLYPRLSMQPGIAHLSAVLEVAHVLEESMQIESDVGRLTLRDLQTQRQASLDKICRALPVFPAVAQRCVELLGSTHATIPDIAAVAAKDPVLASVLIAAANSAFFSRFQTVASIMSAILRLGCDAAKRIIFAACLRPLFASRKLNALWNHSIDTACMAERLARVSGAARLEDSYLAGLVHDIGRMAFALLPCGFQEQSAKLITKGCPAVLVERTLCGRGHDEIGAAILTRWNFPAELVEAVKFHHRPEQSQSVLAALLYLAEDLTREREQAVSALRLSISSQRLRIQASVLDEIQVELDPATIALRFAA